MLGFNTTFAHGVTPRPIHFTCRMDGTQGAAGSREATGDAMEAAEEIMFDLKGQCLQWEICEGRSKTLNFGWIDVQVHLCSNCILVQSCELVLRKL